MGAVGWVLASVLKRGCGGCERVWMVVSRIIANDKFKTDERCWLVGSVSLWLDGAFGFVCFQLAAASGLQFTRAHSHTHKAHHVLSLRLGWDLQLLGSKNVHSLVC